MELNQLEKGYWANILNLFSGLHLESGVTFSWVERLNVACEGLNGEEQAG